MKRIVQLALGCAIAAAGISPAFASHGHGGGGGHHGGGGGGHHSGGSMHHSGGHHHSSGGGYSHHSGSHHHGYYGGGGFYPGYYGGYGYGGYGWPYSYYGGGYYGNGYYNRGYYGNGNYVRTVVSQPQPVGDGQPIKIFNLSDSGADIHFRIDDVEYTLKPGDSMWLTYDRNRAISFDRGAEYGTAEYSLTSGQYWFELTSDHGWEAYHDADVSKLTKKSDDAAAKVNPLPPATK